MSSIYNLEPQPTASLILHTTLGDLSVELFAKQTPLASRNFLQLCLDGYYDGTIFHRLVPGFILQGGDPTGTGNGGESIYDGGAHGGDLDAWPLDQRRGRNAGPHGVNFKDESHSRLKFNRRGLLGMANDGRPDNNASQFFFTLDKAPELDGRNTLFGRIVGDTIYNLARMGESEVAEGGERPLYPIKITGVEILVNPFEDMKKRERVAARNQPSQAAAKPAKKKTKAAKGGKKLLSFGDDEEGGGEEDAPVIKKAKFDTRIVLDLDDGESAEAPKSKKPKSSAKGQAEKAANTSIPAREPVDTTTTPTTETIKRPSPPPPPRGKEASTKSTAYDDESSPEPEQPKKSALERANEEIAALKASMKRTVYDEEEPAAKDAKKTALERLIPESSMRGRKRRRDGDGTMSNADLSAFEAFRSKLVESSSKAKASQPSSNKEKTSTSSKQEKPSKRDEGDDIQHKQQDTNATNKATADDNDDDDDDEAELCDLHFIANCQSCRSWAGEEEEGANKPDNKTAEDTDDDDANDTSWITHTLSFAADKLGKDLTYRKKAEDELIVIDPREKARTLKEEQRARRGEAGGGTGSGREWDQARDQARNAKLARASALAGRGAR